MRKNKLLVTSMVATIGIFSLFGCSGEDKTESETTSVVENLDAEDASEEIEELTTEIRNVGSFNPEDVCKNISINGKIVEFPWTLNKLGDEYDFDIISEDVDNNSYYGANIIYKNEMDYAVCLFEENTINRDSKIVYALLYPADGVELYGLNENSKKEDVVAILGEPNRITEDGITLHYEYISDEMYLAFGFGISNEKLRVIDIDVSKTWDK